jgi:ribonuclease R
MSKKKKKSSSLGKKKTKNVQLKRNVFGVFHKHPDLALNYKQVCSKIPVTDHKDKQQVLQIMAEMAVEGTLEQVERGKYLLKPLEQYVVGHLDFTTSGAAYLVPEDSQEDDIYISPKNVGNALNGDKVKVFRLARRRNKKPEGEVVEILERKRMEFVGTIEMGPSYAFLVPDHKKMLVDIYIPKDKLQGVENGMKAIARITSWPESASSPFGEIIEIIGKPGERDTEMHSILAEFGLPFRFPPEVEREADEIDRTITPEEVAKRRDMRSIPTFTIDPDDAKDFDDALSFQQLSNGHVEVGVHIADVTHYVRELRKRRKTGLPRCTLWTAWFPCFPRCFPTTYVRSDQMKTSFVSPRFLN